MMRLLVEFRAPNHSPPRKVEDPRRGSAGSRLEHPGRTPAKSVRGERPAKEQAGQAVFESGPGDGGAII